MNISFCSIKQLESQIVEASTAYYEGTAIMTDEEFDCRIEALKDLNPDSPMLKTGWGYIPKDRIVEHIGGEVGSLDKVQIADFRITDQVVVTPKYDGLTAVAYFKDGKYIKGVTRGDGKIGQDITSKVKWIIENTTKANLNDIHFTGTSIRGEIVVPQIYEDEVLALGYSNTRNFASGVMNTGDDDYELLKYLHFIPYTIRDSVLSKWDCYLFFVERGFFPIYAVLTGELINTVNPTADHSLVVRTLYKGWKEAYPIDGVVITKVDSIDIDADSYAVKFETEEAIATVDTVEWSTRSTGNIYPVVILKEPVKIHGASIQRLSGYNWKFISDNNIGHNALITITRANEVIPKILGVATPSSKVIWPTECPICGEATTVNGVHLSCNNPTCPSREINQVYAFLSRCNIDKGIGSATWDKYFEYFNVKNFFDFVINIKNWDKVPYVEYLSFLGNSMAKKVAEAILVIGEKIETISYEDILIAMNIPSLGTTHARTLGQYTFDYLKSQGISDVKNFGTNSAVGREVAQRIDKLILTVSILWPENNPTISLLPANISTKTEVCITGKLNYGTRDKFAKVIELYDFTAVDGVSKNTKYLICNSTSSSSKSKAAVKLGIPVISENDFITKFNIVL